jgi:hypothetical protein
MEDSKGYIWIGTKNGVARWDSKNFEYFTIKDGLPNNEVIGIFEDSKGRIWFQTFNNEISYFQNNIVYNKLNDSRLGRFDLRSQTHITEFGGYIHFLNKSDESIKISIDSLKLYPDNFNFTNILSHHNSNLPFSRNSFFGPLKSLIDREGLVSVLKLVASQSNFRFEKPFNTEIDSLYFLYLDSQVRADYRADKLLDKKNYYLQSYKDKIILIDNKLEFVFKNPCISKKLKNNILRLFTIKGQVHFLNKDKYIYHAATQAIKGKLDYTNALYNLSRNESISILTTSYDIFNLNTQQKLIKRDDRYSNFKFGLLSKKEKAIYVGSGSGIFKWTKDSFYDLLYGKRVYSILEDRRDYLWFSTTDSLFYTKNYQQKITDLHPLVLDPKTKIFINEIKEDNRGNIIIATNNGVYIYSPISKNKYRLNDRNLLSSNECQRIEIDPKDNSLWVATFNGLNHIQYSEVKNKLKFDLINRFFESDGLYSNEISDILIQGDSIWVATPKGLNLIHRKNARPDSQDIPIYYNKIYVNKELQGLSTSYQLNSDQNNLTIDFSAIYLQRRDRLMIKYKLIRNQDTLDEVITENKLNLLALKDGEYILQIYAYDQDYPYIKSEFKSLQFTIKPPFYKTWWFWTGLIFGILSILGIYFYSKMLQRKNQMIEKIQIQNKFNELNLKSLRNQMNPHFVFNCLNSIKDFINKNDKISSNKFLTDFARLIRTTLNITRKQYIYIEDEIAYLNLYIQLEQMRFDNQFDFEIINKVPIEIYIELPSMMIQPFVENAIRHGQIGQLDYQGHLQIVFALEGEYLVVHISDNGIGIVEAKKISDMKSAETQSLAIKILEEQIELIQKTYGQNISIDIEDRSVHNEKGTLVILRIHIEEALQN